MGSGGRVSRPIAIVRASSRRGLARARRLAAGRGGAWDSAHVVSFRGEIACEAQRRVKLQDDWSLGVLGGFCLVSYMRRYVMLVKLHFGT